MDGARTELGIQHTEAASPGERINTAISSAMAIASEKNRFSISTNGIPLSEISSALRLPAIAPHVETQIAALGVTISPHLAARRKADILTCAAAGDLSEHKDQPGALKASALLLSSSYPRQQELRDIMEEAKQEGGDAGKQNDVRRIQEKIGSSLARAVETGKINRLLASSITAYAQDQGLDAGIALGIAKVMSLGGPPQNEDQKRIIDVIQVQYDVAKTLLNNQPRAGINPDSVSYFSLGKLSSSLVDQALQIRHPETRKRMLQELAQNKNIPEKIESLREIIQIVSEHPEIQGVSFDLYDTLTQWTEDFRDRWSRYPDRVARIMQKHGYPRDVFPLIQDAVDAAYTDTFQNWAQAIEVPIERRIEHIVSSLNTNPDFTKHRELPAEEQNLVQKQLVKEFYRLELENSARMPGARETLAELKDRGIKICLTSNASWSKQHVERVLKQAGLFQYFDAVSVSSEHGRMKSAGETSFFHHSWDKLGIPYDSILHVGDSASNDREGARNAGGKSTLYQNPLGNIHRIEHNNLRTTSPETYAQTTVEMQKTALEKSFDDWLTTRINKKTPLEERQRILQLSKEMYEQSRDVLGQVYINMAEQLLTKLNNGETETVLGLARDGLPIAAAMKMLLSLDKESYPNVTPDQIQYLHASRNILQRVVSPTSPEDDELRNTYTTYLGQKGLFDKKRITLTDVASGSGNTFRLLSDLLKNAKIDALFADVMGPYYHPDLHSFLQQAVGVSEPILQINKGLFHIESVFSGPLNSISEFRAIEKGGKQFILPKPSKKTDVYNSPEHEHAFSRGLSPDSVLFLNEVAIRGVIDAARVRYRQRLARVPESTDREVSMRFVYQLQEAPISDLRLTIPWHDKYKDPTTGHYRDSLVLPSENPHEDARIPKGNVRINP